MKSCFLPPGCHAAIFFTVFFRVTQDGLIERIPTQSLLQNIDKSTPFFSSPVKHALKYIYHYRKAISQISPDFKLSSFLLGLVFFVYPVEVSEVSKTWSDIKNKINNKCRYLKKQSVTHLSSTDSMVENVPVTISQ